LKLPGPDLIEWASPTNGILGSTQILTRHCGAKSQKVSQLVDSRTIITRQVLIVQPLWVIETTWMEPWGFNKLLAQNNAVHMKLSLRLSF
jgi:hypothetical protein